MHEGKLKHNLHLHLLVFIAGFTAILGELITIDAFPLVWFRMTMAGILIFLYIRIVRLKITISLKKLLQFLGAGVIIALHWITFFASIKEANVSIALAMFSTGAFFAALIEPVFYKRRIIGYEVLFGILVIFGVYLIIDSEIKYLTGIILGISSAFFSALFAVINGRFVEKDDATIISFYEFIGGVAFITLYIALFGEGFTKDFFLLKNTDWLYLFILASICTAYAFIAAVYIMKFISPFTVMLTYNLEPVYGIVLAILIFGESEIMSTNFYYGAILILITVILDGLLKNYPGLFRLKKE
ncbi:MAG: DMT family transporter [Flavobacteriaceae bacterium]|nr:DMT family transporter [Flavobacteriaceae bacterium]